MIDKLGNELNIGDYVLFVQGSCGYKQSPNVCVGKIISYDGKRLMDVDCGPIIFHKTPNACYKVYHP